MKKIRYLKLLLFLIVSFTAELASAQLIQINNTDSDDIGKNDTLFRDNYKDSIRNADKAKELLQLMVVADPLLGMSLGQLFNIGGQVYLYDQFGIGLLYSQSADLIDNMNSDKFLNLSIQIRPNIFKNIISFSFTNSILIYEGKRNYGKVKKNDVYAISIGYFHDIGKVKNIIFEYNIHYSNKINGAIVMPGIKLIYQFI